MKIVQIAVSLNSDGEESLYAVTDDGRVLLRQHCTTNPRMTDFVMHDSTGAVVKDGEGKVRREIKFHTGRTEGWIELGNQMSRKTFEPNDPKRHEHE